MESNRITIVSKAVHKIQLALLEGIRDLNQLFAAFSLMSKSDYEDVVTERSIADLCGYPLCGNPLPTERSRKGRYRLSKKEQKIYDLQEMSKYCSTGCNVNSSTFSASLPAQRCLTFDNARINEILSMFEEANLDVEDERGLENNMNLGLSKLTIQENKETESMLVSLEEWAGPSNAIEGFVPRRNHNTELVSSYLEKKGSEPKVIKLNKDKGIAIEELGFNSVIITDDEYSVSKSILHDGEAKPLPSEKPLQNGRQSRKASLISDMDFTSAIINQDEYTVSKPTAETSKSDTNEIPRIVKGKTKCSDPGTYCKGLKNSPSCVQNDPRRCKLDSTILQDNIHPDSKISLIESRISSSDTQERHSAIKSSLKSSSARRNNRTVTWADEKSSSASGSNLCEYKELEGEELPSEKGAGRGDEDDLRFASANACAAALAEAAEAVVSGKSEVDEAVSAAGIVLMPEDTVQSGTESAGEEEHVKSELGKWPEKPTIPEIDGFDTEDSWFDSPPDGFSLILSPFATIWNAVFTWTTSSSVAYIYGKDDSHQEEFLNTNGREYLKKILLPDGRSSEIKQTMSGCLARALPGVISDLKLATPISTLEQRIACLLDTMSFVEALPPFRMKQWQVIVLLFIDALSVCRIPGLAPQLSSKRVSMSKVLEGAKMSMAEYETMKDIVLPLSRA